MRTLALTLKILAIVFWLGSAWLVLNLDVRDVRASSPPQYRDAPRDWGTPEYYRRTYFHIAETTVLLLLALIPNRLLVCSRIAWGAALVVALIPLARVLYSSEFPFGGGGEIILSGFVLVMIVGMFSPLPLSLFFSFLRRQKGQTVSYA